MKNMKRAWVFAMAAMMSLAMAACGNGNGEASPRGDGAAPGAELNVSAAASLTDALEEIYAEYRKESPDVINFNFAASGTLQKQIIEGAPCDMFISASKGHMDGLEAEGLTAGGSRRDLLANRLTLVASEEKSGTVRLDNLDSGDVAMIAIGEPEAVPAGQYAKQSLESLGIWDNVQGKLIFGKDVRQVLEYVDTGNVDCGVVYRSDTAVMENGAIIGDLPEDSHDPIVYPAALMAGSENLDAAQAFFDFLLTPFAGGVFEKYGFTVL